MKIAVPIPVFGRLPLVKLTIERLRDVNKVDHIICIGHEPEAKELCLSLGAEWVEYPNSPLGAKWNAGFMACQKYNPDAVLYCGSSDWIHQDYLNLAIEHIYGGADMVGSLGCYFVDVRERRRAVFWPGYGEGKRHDEPIGIGRMLSKRLLECMGYKPFEDYIHNSLDRVMWDKSLACNADVRIINVVNGLLSISCDRWPNKHNFEDHWSNTLPSVKIHHLPGLFNSFPEIHKL